WGSLPRTLLGQRLAPLMLMAVTAITIGVLIFNSALWPFAFAVEGAIGLMYRRRVRDLLEGVERPEKELLLLSQILERIEKEKFQSARLVALQRSLTVDRLAVSKQITRLARLTNALNWR